MKKHSTDHTQPVPTMARCAWTAIKAAGYGNDSCVLAARVIADCLTVLGKTPRTVPVSFEVYSPRFLELASLHGMPDEATALAWKESDPLVYIVATDTTSANDGRFAGHLVTLCDGWFLDPSIMQAHRPHRGIHLKPVYLEAPAGFPDGKRRIKLFSVMPDDDLLGVGRSLVVYEHLDNHADYTRAPDWQVSKSSPLVYQAVQMYTTFMLNRKQDA
jgi:hypothetical protein